MKKSWVLIIIIVVLIVMGMFSASKDVINNSIDTNKTGVDDETHVNVDTICDFDKIINLFINKYNTKYDDKITVEMISKGTVKGKEREDIANIKNDKLEIKIYHDLSNLYPDSNNISVWIGYVPDVTASTEEYKEQFIKYVKLLDDSLTNEECESYWNDMISTYRSTYEINDIDISVGVYDGVCKYFKLSKKDVNMNW